MRESIRKALEAAVLKPTANGQTVGLDVDQASSDIFATNGKKFTFVFNQNLRRTNVQLAELIALIRMHTYDESGRSMRLRLDFLTFEELKRLILDALAGVDISDKQEFESLAEEISSFCENKALMEIYYGTASIFLPLHLSIKLDLVAAESGYIHSCGELLLLRNAEKAKVSEFEEAVLQGLSLATSEDDRFMLVPYCHEDFSSQDRSTPFLQHGLDDIKLNISKAYVGGKRLYDVIDDIADANRDHLTIAPTNFKKSTDHFFETFPAKRLNSIWIISDADTMMPSRFPGSRKFYVVYIQRYKNNNFYHVYDENKPGWASHTTIPHSLAGAMINLARPWVRSDDISIADPFGGSGTIFLESQKLNNVTCVTSDLAPIFKFTIEDNTAFFRLEKQALVALRSELEGFKDVVPDFGAIEPRRRRAESKDRRLARIAGVVREWSKSCHGDFIRLKSDELSPGFAQVGSGLADRLLAYIALRASVRGVADFERGTASWLGYFRRELDEMVSQMERHEKWITSGAEPSSDNDHVSVGLSPYSAASTPRAPEIGRFDLFEQLDFATQDVRMLPRNKYDAVITDPPYGFNTDENYWELSKFIHELIPCLVESLKLDGGQLILAAPQQSFSGRAIIPFVKASYIGREIIRYCADHSRECIVPASILPNTLADLHPPYYWVAEKTLQRKILHFWIRQTA